MGDFLFMTKLLRFTFVALVIITVGGCTADHRAPERLLYVWLHDKTMIQPNFLAVLDADSNSANYGQIITTVPVGERGGMAHHTQIYLPKSGMIFANDFTGNSTYIFDTTEPAQPRLARQFGSIETLTFAHSYSELPNGNMLATFQTEGSSNEIAGGLVEFSPYGEVIRSSSARTDDDSIFMRPYGIVLVPKLNRVVTTNFDMREANDGRHIQIWDLETLDLLTTLAVPESSPLPVHLNPFEGRLLSDGTTVMFQTYSCGLYMLTDIETDHPTASYVHNFAEERYCSLPVRRRNYWVQTVDDENGDLQEVAVLDVKNPNDPKKVGGIPFDSDFSPHWLSPDATGKKIVLTGYGKELSRRIIMLDFDASTGDLKIDETFGDGDERGPGVIISDRIWPHGFTGDAKAHAAIFWPPATPDWQAK